MAHHGADPGPEAAGAEAGRADDGGEDLSAVDVADGQSVDGGDPAQQVQHQHLHL